LFGIVGALSPRIEKRLEGRIGAIMALGKLLAEECENICVFATLLRRRSTATVPFTFRSAS
jgi:hypothetical protein